MVTHRGTQTLQTRRLILRRVELTDAPSMFLNWASDESVTRYLTWPPHASVEVTKLVVADWVRCYEQDDFYQWVIVLEDQPIGSISVVDRNDRVGKAEIGYCIGKLWWHQGIMTEALQAVMDFLFDQVNMNRLEARHDPRNPNSGKVMAKCGMKYEGTLHQSDINNQGICDAAVWALLKENR